MKISSSAFGLFKLSTTLVILFSTKYYSVRSFQNIQQLFRTLCWNILKQLFVINTEASLNEPYKQPTPGDSIKNGYFHSEDYLQKESGQERIRGRIELVGVRHL